MTTTPSAEPVTADRSEREAVIRDLYALAAFYVANPEHPLPQHMTLSHYVDDRQVVEQCQELYGSPSRRVYGTSQAQMDHALKGTSMDVTLIVCTPSGKKVDDQ